ncbi:hypothetical protein [Lysobacter gummosus]
MSLTAPAVWHSRRRNPQRRRSCPASWSSNTSPPNRWVRWIR